MRAGGVLASGVVLRMLCDGDGQEVSISGVEIWVK